jgi:hypothetical protein
MLLLPLLHGFHQTGSNAESLGALQRYPLQMLWTCGTGMGRSSCANLGLYRGARVCAAVSRYCPQSSTPPHHTPPKPRAVNTLEP